jgi:hypothetical protein
LASDGLWKVQGYFIYSKLINDNKFWKVEEWFEVISLISCYLIAEVFGTVKNELC